MCNQALHNGGLLGQSEDFQIYSYKWYRRPYMTPYNQTGKAILGGSLQPLCITEFGGGG